MVSLSPASIVVVEFPFSDLSGSKLRPAVVFTSVGRGDWILCQITSNAHADPDAVKLAPANLKAGTLADISYARPTKLFTAHEALINKRIAILQDETFREIVLKTIDVLRRVV